MSNPAIYEPPEPDGQPAPQVGEDPGIVEPPPAESPGAPRSDEPEVPPEGEPTPS
jgi:hypothetical protein